MELLLVMVIIATLAALVLPNLAGRSEESRITAGKAQIELFRSALASYEIDGGTFPSTEQGLEALVREPTGDPAPTERRHAPIFRGDAALRRAHVFRPGPSLRPRIGPARTAAAGHHYPDRRSGRIRARRRPAKRRRGRGRQRPG